MFTYKYSKNNFKDKIKKLSVKELFLILQDLERELFILKTSMIKGGTIGKYDVGSKGNIKNLHKSIAVVKTYLNVKLKGDFK